MSNESLRASVRELRSELAQVGDPKVRADLTALLARIEADLAAREEEEDEHESLVDGLRDNLQELKLRHPRAAAFVNRVMATLGEAGI